MILTKRSTHQTQEAKFSWNRDLLPYSRVEVHPGRACQPSLCTSLQESLACLIQGFPHLLISTFPPSSGTTKINQMEYDFIKSPSNWSLERKNRYESILPTTSCSQLFPKSIWFCLPALYTPPTHSFSLLQASLSLSHPPSFFCFSFTHTHTHTLPLGPIWCLLNTNRMTSNICL